MICNICPRRCGAERTETYGGGFCRMPAVPVIARAGLHPVSYTHLDVYKRQILTT